MTERESSAPVGRRLLRRCLPLWIVALSLFGLGGGASEAQVREKRIALIVSNSDYGPTASLGGVKDDAQHVADALNFVGFESTTPRENLTQEGLRQAVDDFRKRVQAAGPAAIGFFYYAGHGGLGADGKNYLIPSRSVGLTGLDIQRDGYAVDSILEAFGRDGSKPAPRAVAIAIDACRTLTNGAANSGLGQVRKPDPSKAGFITGFASLTGTPASDSGYYAEALARAIRMSGLTLPGVFDQVQQDVHAHEYTQLPVSTNTITDQTVCLVDCQTIEARLQAIGYPATASGLAQALSSGDQRALGLFADGSVPLATAEEALRTQARPDDPSTAQRYFEKTRGAPKALAWLGAMLNRKAPDRLDPNLRVPNQGPRDEAIINAAARAGNVDAVMLLLSHNANANGFQDVTDWAIADPRFMIPFGPVFHDANLSTPDKRRLLQAFVDSGAIVPRIPVRNPGGVNGAVAADFVNLQDELHNTGGDPLPVSQDLCDKPAPTACTRSTLATGSDWCSVVQRIPRVFGQFTPPARNDQLLPPFIVRYFMGADRRAGYFLVELLTYDSGYAVLQVDKELRELHLLEFTMIQPYNAQGCIGDVDRVGFCWRSLELDFDPNKQLYRNDYGTLTTSPSCTLATSQRKAREEAVKPHPFTDPDPKVAACVNEIAATPFNQLMDDAAKFNIFAHDRLDARGCVLAMTNSALLTQQASLRRPDYVTAQAKLCCEKVLGRLPGPKKGR